MWIPTCHQNLLPKQQRAQKGGSLGRTHAVQLLVGALQTLLGLLGLHQILQTFKRKIGASQRGWGGEGGGAGAS